MKYDTIRFGKRAQNDVDVGEENGETIATVLALPTFVGVHMRMYTHTHTSNEYVKILNFIFHD